MVDGVITVGAQKFDQSHQVGTASTIRRPSSTVGLFSLCRLESVLVSLSMAPRIICFIVKQFSVGAFHVPRSFVGLPSPRTDLRPF
jgi:hypothetical protein